MTFGEYVGALRWYMYEKGLQRQFAPLQALANAAFGSGVTMPGGSTFGDIILSDPTYVDQTPTGATGLIPGDLTLPNPGRDRIPGSTEPDEPHMGFRE